MSEKFHVHRAIAELEVALTAPHRDATGDPRLGGALQSLKDHERERIAASGMDARYWPETEAAGFRRDAKRAARRAVKEKDEEL